MSYEKQATQILTKKTEVTFDTLKNLRTTTQDENCNKNTAYRTCECKTCVKLYEAFEDYLFN